MLQVTKSLKMSILYADVNPFTFFYILYFKLHFLSSVTFKMHEQFETGQLGT